MIHRRVVHTYTRLLGRSLATHTHYNITRSSGPTRLPPPSLLRNVPLSSRQFGSSSIQHSSASVVIPILTAKEVLEGKEIYEEDQEANSNKTASSETAEPKKSSVQIEPSSESKKVDTSSGTTTGGGGGSRNPSWNASLERSIREAKDVETLLEIGRSVQVLGLKISCQIIHRLGQVVKADKSNKVDLTAFENDPRFIKISKSVRKASYSNVPPLLLVALQAIESIGFTTEHEIVKELEHELKWIMRRCPIRFVARTIHSLYTGKVEIGEAEDLGFVLSSKNTPEQKLEKIPPGHPITTAIQTIERRWVEIATGGEFISTFKIMNHLPAETREKLEDRAVEMVQDFSVLEMVKIFVVLSHQKRRPTPLLRALGFHVSKSTEKIPTKDLIELVYALNELTFADPILMGKLCNDLLFCIPTIESPALISSLVVSIGRMRYYNKDLVSVLGEWLTKHVNDLRTFDCAAWLLASAVLNVDPATYPKLYDRIQTALPHEAVPNPIEWVNIVHGMSILNLATPELVSTVLTPEFVKEIDSHETSQPSRIKLLHLNALARAGEKLGFGGYKGKFLSKEIQKKWTDAVAPSDPKLSKVVVESLSHFLPPPKYVLTDIKSESGVFIDAICLINEKLDPIPVSSKDKAKKVAIVVQGYTALTLGVKVPTGSSALSSRLLESEGYHVIPIPYTEFSSKDKLLSRVQYLEQRIRNVEIFEKASSNETMQSPKSSSSATSSR